MPTLSDEEHCVHVGYIFLFTFAIISINSGNDFYARIVFPLPTIQIVRSKRAQFQLNDLPSLEWHLNRYSFPCQFVRLYTQN